MLLVPTGVTAVAKSGSTSNAIQFSKYKTAFYDPKCIFQMQLKLGDQKRTLEGRKTEMITVEQPEGSDSCFI